MTYDEYYNVLYIIFVQYVSFPKRFLRTFDHASLLGASPHFQSKYVSYEEPVRPKWRLHPRSAQRLLLVLLHQRSHRPGEVSCQDWIHLTGSRYHALIRQSKRFWICFRLQIYEENKHGKNPKEARPFFVES